MSMILRLLFLAAPLLLGGCVVGTVASTAVDIVKIPVKVVSAGVDAATTSQSEADEKRGRELRKAEEKAGKEAREAEKRAKKAASQPQSE
ncbi:MAG TPA: hypothetical protein VK485_08790 [Sphingomicrobium sp.]|nr:hypothetical protein [Sphingomicrobium sp.]